MPAHVPRKRHAHLCGLAALLQQSRRGSWPGSFSKDASLLHRKGGRHPERHCQHPGCEFALPAPGAVERGADLYNPCKEAYQMLKGAVVGGPSIVFTRYHVVSVIKIRVHQIENPRLCQNILGYDANALYLSTMLRDMPCGKEKVVHYTQEKGDAWVLTQRLKADTWFGFAEVDIETPEPLWPKFAEMIPFFLNKEVPSKAVPQHMLDYLQKTGRNRGDGKKLVGALSAEKLQVYAPLLRRYLDHGAVITAVYRTIDYQAGKIFPWFVEQVTEARARETWKKARRCSRRCSNCWEAAASGSSSKRWSAKQT